MVEMEHARDLLSAMGLSTAASLLDAHLEQAIHEELTYVQFLDSLLPRNKWSADEKARKQG